MLNLRQSTTMRVSIRSEISQSFARQYIAAAPSRRLGLGLRFTFRACMVIPEAPASPSRSSAEELANGIVAGFTPPRLPAEFSRRAFRYQMAYTLFYAFFRGSWEMFPDGRQGHECLGCRFSFRWR